MYRMQKRLFYSLAIVLVWLGFVVEGSHALLSGSASMVGNTISTGSVDLQVSTSQGATPTDFANSQTGFSYNLLPGQIQDEYFFLRNVSASNVALDISHLVNVTSGPTDLLSSISLEMTPVDSGGSPTGSSVKTTLQSLSNQLVNTGATLGQGAIQRFRIRSSVDPAYAQRNQLVKYDLYLSGVQHYVP